MKIIGQRLGIDIPMRTEGMYALKESYENGMRLIGRELGITIKVDTLGHSGFEQSLLGNLKALDTAIVAVKTFAITGAPTTVEGGSLAFTITRPDGTGSASVRWTVTGGTASPADFVGGVYPGAIVTFANGETTKTITLQTLDDTAVEALETVLVSLVDPLSGWTVAVGTATGTVSDNDVSGPVSLYAGNLTRPAVGQTVALNGNDGFKPHRPTTSSAIGNLGVNEFGQVVQVALDAEPESYQFTLLREFAAADEYTVAFFAMRPPANQRTTLRIGAYPSSGSGSTRCLEFTLKDFGGIEIVSPDIAAIADLGANEADLGADGQDIHVHVNRATGKVRVILHNGRILGPFDISAALAKHANVGFVCGLPARRQEVGRVLGYAPKVWPGYHLGGSGRGDPGDATFSAAPSITRQGGGTSYAVGDVVSLFAGTVDPQTGTLVDSELRRGTAVIAVDPLPPTYTVQQDDEGRALRIVSLGQNSIGKITTASSVTALIAGTGVPQPQPILGMGVGGQEYYGSTRIYENLFLAARWQGFTALNGGTEITLTDDNHPMSADGFPTSMTMKDGAVLARIERRIQNVVRADEPMRIAWTGNITCQLFGAKDAVRSGNRIDYRQAVAPGVNDYATFQITAIAMPLTALDCREKDRADNASATVRNRVFNPAFIAEQKQFAILRTMDILNTNGNVREETWVNRARNRWRTARAGAMPWEDIVALANETKCDLWVN